MNITELDPDDNITRALNARPRVAPQRYPKAERFRVANAHALVTSPGRTHKLDTWLNPCSQTQTITIRTNDEIGDLILEWEPGEKHALDSTYRSAIHHLVETGDGRVIIAGGLAPLLQRVGQTARVHGSITEEAIERDRRKEASQRDENGVVQFRKEGDFDV